MFTKKEMTVQFRKQKLVLHSSILVIAAVVFSGCLKSVETTPPKPQTYMSILHLAAAAPAVDVYLNNTKSSSTPIPSGSFFSRYSALAPDIYTIVFKKATSDSVVATVNADVYDSLTYSTILLYDDPSGPGARAMRIEDDFSNFSNTQTNVRFFHLSEGLMPVDLYFDNNVVMSHREFADNTMNSLFNMFSQRESGYFSVSVKKAGTDSLIYQTSTTLQQAQAYTILLSGVPGGTGDKAITVDILQAAN